MKRGSTIVNTTSVTAYQGKENLIDYSSTKGAVVTFTRSLSQSLAKHGIRVNAVAPGIIATDMVTALDQNMIKAMVANVPVGRIGEPEDIANAFLFLASDMASYISGAILSVDGATVI